MILLKSSVTKRQAWAQIPKIVFITHMRPIKYLRFYVATQKFCFIPWKPVDRYPVTQLWNLSRSFGDWLLIPYGEDKNTPMEVCGLRPQHGERRGALLSLFWGCSSILPCVAVWPKLKSLHSKFGEPRSVFGTATGLLVDLGKLFTSLYFNFFPNKLKLFLPNLLSSWFVYKMR